MIGGCLRAAQVETTAPAVAHGPAMRLCRMGKLRIIRVESDGWWGELVRFVTILKIFVLLQIFATTKKN